MPSPAGKATGTYVHPNAGPHYQLPPVLAPSLEITAEQYALYLANYKIYVEFVAKLRSERNDSKKQARQKKTASEPKKATEQPKPVGEESQEKEPQEKEGTSRANLKRKARKSARRKMRRALAKTQELKVQANVTLAQAELLKAQKVNKVAAEKLINTGRTKKTAGERKRSAARLARNAKRQDKQAAYAAKHKRSDEQKVSALTRQVARKTERLNELLKKRDDARTTLGAGVTANPDVATLTPAIDQAMTGQIQSLRGEIKALQNTQKEKPAEKQERPVAERPVVAQSLAPELPSVSTWVSSASVVTATTQKKSKYLQAPGCRGLGRHVWSATVSEVPQSEATEFGYGRKCSACGSREFIRRK